MPETGSRTDPYRQYNWRVEVGESAWAHFTYCEGLGVSVDVIKYREAGNNQIMRAIPGQITYEPVTLHYGLTSSQDVFSWLMAAIEGRPDRRNVSIAMLDSTASEEVLRWNLEACWIAQWRAPKLDAASSNVAIENMTLVYERLTRVNSG
jgi:phage tail-like protein